MGIRHFDDDPGVIDPGRALEKDLVPHLRSRIPLLFVLIISGRRRGITVERSADQFLRLPGAVGAPHTPVHEGIAPLRWIVDIGCALRILQFIGKLRIVFVPVVGVFSIQLTAAGLFVIQQFLFRRHEELLHDKSRVSTDPGRSAIRIILHGRLGIDRQFPAAQRPWSRFRRRASFLRQDPESPSQDHHQRQPDGQKTQQDLLSGRLFIVHDFTSLSDFINE